MTGRSNRGIPLATFAILLCLSGPGILGAAESQERSLVGLWGASRGFGPEIRGELTITRVGDVWRAEIGGRSVEVELADGAVAFELPGDRGEFLGEVVGGGERIVGHWLQPRATRVGMRLASPVELKRRSGEEGSSMLWRGEVVPFEDGYSFYLVVKEREDGSMGAFLRNPERNLGVFLNVDRLELEGDSVRLIGRRFRRRDESVLAEGTYRSDMDSLSLFIPRASGTYDFERLDDDRWSSFYPRGESPKPWVYRRPSPGSDGWPVGTFEDAGISEDPIREMIETEILQPAESVRDLYVHGLLIARHGKLVLEEYFHGFDRSTPHDTRSASKSLTATLVGAAIEAGEPLRLGSPVYETIYGEDIPPDLDPRKRRVTVEDLMTMAPGLDCDDSDPTSQGNEELMQEQEEELDWYRYTLALPMVREPGEKAVYCSASANLVGAVLSSATGESLPHLFHRLIAEPLQMERYHLVLSPSGEPYMGGGIQWLPRDFMKLGQVYLDGGLWQDRRILGSEFAERAVSTLFDLRERGYGYLWWVVDYPHQGGSVRAFFAGGNGGQLVIGVPELDLLVSFFGGNYSDRVFFRLQDELVPKYILEAVDRAPTASAGGVEEALR